MHDLLASGINLFNSTGSTVGTLLVIAATFGGAAAIFRSNRVQTTVKVLQDLSDSLQRQNTNQKGQLEDQQRRIDAQNARIDDLKSLMTSVGELTSAVKSLTDEQRDLTREIRRREERR